MVFPVLPGNLNKAIFILGIFLVGFSEYQYIEYNKAIATKSLEYSKIFEDYNIELYKQVLRIEGLYELGASLSKRYNIDNPVTINKDSSRYQIHWVSEYTSDNQKLVYDSIRKLSSVIDSHNTAVKVIQKRYGYVSEDALFLNKTQEGKIKANRRLEQMGIILVVIGIIGWVKESIEEQKLRDFELSKISKYKYCQSCGQNFSFYLSKGIEKTGKESDKFCDQCYVNGQFTETLTPEEYKQKMKNILKNEKWYRKPRLALRFSTLLRMDNDSYSAKQYL